MLHHAVCLALAGLAVICPWLAAREVPGAEKGPLVLDDPVEVLVPKDQRAEFDRDQITASALFAHGRLLFQRNDFAGALRRYQRAWRYDSQAVSILHEIVPLAFDLQRHDEAARYALLAPEFDHRYLVLLRRLALHLTQQEDFAGAVRLYETLMQMRQRPDQTEFLLRMEMGRLYFLVGEYQKAADSFAVVRDALADPEKYGVNDDLKKAVLGEPEKTYGLMAESFLQASRFMEAAEMFQKADEASPNKGKLALQLARVEAEQGNTDAALQQLEIYFDEKLSIGGGEPYELYFFLLKKKLGDEKKAIDAARQRLVKLYEDDPSNAALGYALADKYRDQGKLAEAVTVYREALRIQPALDGYDGLLKIYQQQNDLEKLLDTLGEAVSKTGGIEQLGDTAENLLESDELVEKLFQTAQQRMKDENKQIGEGVALATALIALDTNRFDEAGAFFDEALTSPQPPKQQVFFTWGLGLMLADEYERAAEVFRRAIDEKAVPEDNPSFHFYLAGALEMAGETEEALDIANEAASRRPDDPRFQTRAAWILYHAKRYDEAEKTYLQFLDEFGDQYDSSTVRESVRDAKVILSTICVHQEKLDEAIEWLEQVLDEFPEDVGALNDLGYLWADEGVHLHRALAMTRKAVAGEPDNAAYRDSLGWALYRLGRYDEAVKQLEQAADYEDPDGVILDHLGDAYLKTNQKETAIDAWRRAAKALEKQDPTNILNQVQEKVKQHSAE